MKHIRVMQATAGLLIAGAVIGAVQQRSDSPPVAQSSNSSAAVLGTTTGQSGLVETVRTEQFSVLGVTTSFLFWVIVAALVAAIVAALLIKWLLAMHSQHDSELMQNGANTPHEPGEVYTPFDDKH